jgi:hypothetical protein
MKERANKIGAELLLFSTVRGLNIEVKICNKNHK